jgi:uncharacterized damage-inducible protein DinB
MTSAISKEFIDQSLYRIEESTNRVIKCLEEIDEEEIWKSPNDHSNAVGNLILHFCGNLRQYIISAIRGVEDIRIRDKEFSTKTGFTKEALLNQLKNTVSGATQIIRESDDNTLLKIYSVQGFELSGIGIILHVTEHYSYHTGQIAFWTKQLKNKDLDFYAGINLNAKNETRG